MIAIPTPIVVSCGTGLDNFRRNVDVAPTGAVSKDDLFNPVLAGDKIIFDRDRVAAPAQCQIIGRASEDGVGDIDAGTEFQSIAITHSSIGLDDDVIAIALIEEVDIVAHTSNQSVISLATDERVAAIATIECVIAIATDERIVAARAIESVVALATHDEIITLIS